MKRINLVKTDDKKTSVGSITQTPTGLQLEGVGIGVFNSLKRAYGADPPKDSELFAILADGWSNGPVMSVTEEV